MSEKVRHENLFVEDWLNRQDDDGCGCASGSGCGSCEGSCGHEKEKDEHVCNCSGKVTSDNREDLFQKFYLKFSQPEELYAAGYRFFCKNCNEPALELESWFPCQGKYVTTIVRCRLGCGAVWFLELPERISGKEYASLVGQSLQ